MKKDLGPKYGTSILTTSISQNGDMTTAHGTMGCNSGMSQHTLKPQMGNKNKTSKGPTQKNIKVGHSIVGKENSDVGARGKMQGEKKEEVASMEVEASDVGGKRKERIPLEDISADEEKGKKQKLGGEVMDLGKIMTKHLGSTLAAEQPHQE